MQEYKTRFCGAKATLVAGSHGLCSLGLLHRVPGPLLQEEEQAPPRGSSLASWSLLGSTLIGRISWAEKVLPINDAHRWRAGWPAIQEAGTLHWPCHFGRKLCTMLSLPTLP